MYLIRSFTGIIYIDYGFKMVTVYILFGFRAITPKLLNFKSVNF